MNRCSDKHNGCRQWMDRDNASRYTSGAGNLWATSQTQPFESHEPKMAFTFLKGCKKKERKTCDPWSAKP